VSSLRLLLATRTYKAAIIYIGEAVGLDCRQPKGWALCWGIAPRPARRAHGLSKTHGWVSEKGAGLNGLGRSRPVKQRGCARLSADPSSTRRALPKYRGRRREAGATSPSANAMPPRGTELFRFLIFTVRQAGTVKLDPCLADAPCRRSGPAISKCERETRSPPFDFRRPVWRSHRRRSKSKT